LTPDFVYELKLDGFRALVVIEHGRAQLISRNGHRFASFPDLANDIAAAIPDTRAVLDGEIVCLDREGKSQFRDLLFHRGFPCFFAFDILFSAMARSGVGRPSRLASMSSGDCCRGYLLNRE